MSEKMVKALDECARCMEETVKKCGKGTVNNLLEAALQLWNSISDGELPKIATDLYYAKNEDFLYQDFENVLSEEDDDLDWYETEEDDKKRALFGEIKWYLDHDECYTCSNTEALSNALSSMRYDAQKAKEDEEDG